MNGALSGQKENVIHFRAVILLGGKTATGLPVPAEVVEALGAGKRPAVRVAINGYSYRSTVASMGGVFMLPISAEHRQAAGVAAGDEVDVSLEVDSAPRQVQLPPDFAAALATEADAQRYFESLAYSHRLRYVLQIEQAKTAETRQRRIQKAVAMLREDQAGKASKGSNGDDK